MVRSCQFCETAVKLLWHRWTSAQQAPLWRNIATRKEMCNARNKITNGSIIGGSGCTVRRVCRY